MQKNFSKYHRKDKKCIYKQLKDVKMPTKSPEDFSSIHIETLPELILFYLEQTHTRRAPLH